MVIKIVFLAHRKEGEKGHLKTPKVNTAAEKLHSYDSGQQQGCSI